MIPSPRDVILNGGEAAVRDRTTAGALDVVDRTPQVHAAYRISPTLLPLSARRTVRRKAIASSG